MLSIRKVFSGYLVAMIMIIIVLLAFNAVLFMQNIRYRTKNKQLIIQNDSLFSAHPQMKAKLDTLKAQQQYPAR